MAKCHNDHPPPCSAKYLISASLRVINLSLISIGKYLHVPICSSSRTNLTNPCCWKGTWVACSQGTLEGGSHRLVLQFEKSQHLASRGMLSPLTHTSCHWKFLNGLCVRILLWAATFPPSNNALAVPVRNAKSLHAWQLCHQLKV